MTNFTFQDAKYWFFSKQHDIKVDAHCTYTKIDISVQFLSSCHLLPVLSRFSNVAEATAIRSLWSMRTELYVTQEWDGNSSLVRRVICPKRIGIGLGLELELRLVLELRLELGLGLASNFGISTTPFLTNDPSDKWTVTEWDVTLEVTLGFA